MDRATRDKFVSGTLQVDLTTGSAAWETAPCVFDKLQADFGPFNIDLTADAWRALCPIWFGPGSPYGVDVLLVHRWIIWGRTGYSNPPYGDFVQRLLGHAKFQATHGFSSTLLLPMRVTRAFKAHVLKGAADLLFCDKRLVFFEQGVPRINEKAWLKKGVLRADSALFDSILVRYTPGTPLDASPTLGLWEVPVHVTKDDLERARELLLLRAVRPDAN